MEVGCAQRHLCLRRASLNVAVSFWAQNNGCRKVTKGENVHTTALFKSLNGSATGMDKDFKIRDWRKATIEDWLRLLGRGQLARLNLQR